MRPRPRVGGPWLLPVLLMLVACGGDATQPGGAPATVVITAGAVQRGVVGQPLDTALTVRVSDRRGDAVSGVVVRFYTNDQAAGQIAPEFDTTDQQGRATSTWTLGTLAGADRFALATVVGIDTVIFKATPLPAGPGSVAFVSGDSQSAVIAATLDSQVVARVRDPYGNAVPGALVTLAATAGGGQVTPGTIPSDSQGLVRAAWTMGPSPGYDTLIATVNGLSPARIGAESHPFPPVDSVALGIAHSCRLNPAGQTFCWGLNFAGEVGSGDTLSAFTPTVLAGAPQFRTIAAGGRHSCGLTAQSALYCWGTMGTLLGLSPTPQAFGENFLSIGSGRDFLCGITVLSQAYCWGDNAGGQLGDGTSTPRTSPVAVLGGHRFRQVGGGNTHACGLSTGGRALCWGTGPLGTGGPDPNPLLTLRFVSIAVGAAGNCGLTLSGEAWCWGSGSATLVSPTLRFSRLAVGGQAMCGISVAGAGYCWGANDYGQLGDGTQIGRAAPTVVSGGLSFAELRLGETHTCGVTLPGEVYCWGGSSTIALGLGETMRSRTPTAVQGGLQFSSLSAGDGFTCGVTAGGAGYCWGWNDRGQLGDGSTEWRTVPTPISGGYSFSQVSAGIALTCGVTAQAAGLCWGDNSYGESGQGVPGPIQLTPALINGGLSLAQITAGNFHVCARTQASAGYCWGDNFFGQVGDSSAMTPRPSPLPLAGGHQWSQLSAGNQFTCGITTAGWGMCWGSGIALGNGGVDRTYPDSVHLGVTVSRLASSISVQNACAVGTDQVGYCWGPGVSSPVAVPGGLSFTDIGTGNTHTCGLAVGGAAYCWGDNSLGSVGDGTLVSRAAPTAVAGALVFTQITVGNDHSCGLDASGAAWCWGDNYFGALGNGGSAVYPTPVRVQ